MQKPQARPRQFASDNNAPICPEAWAALAEVNHGHVRAYGDDPWTKEAADALREAFASDCEVFFVFNGTAANALAVSILCRSHEAVFCHEASHMQTDECGAPEFFSRAKLLLVGGRDGKIDLKAMRRMMQQGHGIHASRPTAVSVTQVTECGTVYSLAELEAVRDAARELGLYVHMDGARFANAMVALDATAGEVIAAGGVDVLCLGGTKNGLLGCEAMLFFNHRLAEDFEYRRKQGGQLASKMRYLAAQWLGVLKDGAWLRHAAHANAMAARLEEAFRALGGLTILHPRQASAVFVRLPTAVAQGLFERGWAFHNNFPGPDDYRIMCSWDTREEDIAAFASDLRDLFRAQR